ncbi:MAG: phosphoadenosine phosphosulfate reductase family protein [Clostridiales bacterium]|nr:phosphoadenosine phosphosulfate reductase family protein [Clostridiales bacterium]
MKKDNYIPNSILTNIDINMEENEHKNNTANNFVDDFKYKKNKLVILQRMPLEIKIDKAIKVIEDAIYECGREKIYISYSGGKDSTVLSHLIRSKYPNMLHIFSNTTNEYPETIEHIKWEVDNNGMNLISTIPKNKKGEYMNFEKVVEKYGYPMFSKEIACAIRVYRRAMTERTKEYTYDYINRNFKKYLRYINCNISDRCCDVLKKRPIKAIERKLGMKGVFLGILAEESRRRTNDWIKHGCNFWTKTNLISKPLSIWTEDDIYEYINRYNVKISDLYNKGYLRNGCMYCGFGVHLEGDENRFIRLKQTHPKAYEYLIENFKSILDECNIKY